MRVETGTGGTRNSAKCRAEGLGSAWGPQPVVFACVRLGVRVGDATNSADCRAGGLGSTWGLQP
eukprot:11467406-Alexandrium_andersonii.AAC.1